MSEALEVMTHCAEETQALGRSIGEALEAGDLCLLSGELGAGKTTLTQGILRGLGGDDYASSPTFVLISEYTARLTLYHVDLYRISKPEDTFELGLDEILDGDGLCVVEWAERALDQFPVERLTVELLRTGDETRSLVIKASESGYTRYLQEISTIGTSRQAYGQASNGAGS